MNTKTKVTVWYLSAFIIPTFIYFFISVYYNLWSFEELLSILTSIQTPVFVVAFITAMFILIRIKLNHIENYHKEKTEENLILAQRSNGNVHKIFLSTLIVYCILGPNIAFIGQDFLDRTEHILSLLLAIPMILIFSAVFFIPMVTTFEKFCIDVPVDENKKYFNLSGKMVSTLLFNVIGAVLIMAIGAVSIIYKNDGGDIIRELAIKISVTGVIILFVSILNMMLLIRQIITPINLTSKAALQLAKGDLTINLNAETKDETGKLVSSVSSLAANLKEIISVINNSASSFKISSDQIFRGNQDLSSRTSEQAASIEELSASSTEMTTLVTSSSDNADEINVQAIESKKAMQDIKEFSEKISEIIGVIDEIAFQTNLLALNASIEAARAGESGKGFEVVATEVRVLSQKTKEQSREITDLIRDSVEYVNKGVELIEKIAASTDTISTGAKQNAEAMIQISETINQLDNATQQNASLAEESAAASEKISSIASNMLDKVRFFKI